MSYAALIREHAAALGSLGANVAHIEAWMRIEHPTLDGLSPREFRREVVAALQCIDAATREQSDALAASLGIVAA